MNWLKRIWKSLSTPVPGSPAPQTTKITVKGVRGDSIEAMANFTPAAQQVLNLARTEADRLHHNFVGTEHVLLGLIKLGQGVAVNVLVKQGLNLETVRLDIEKRVGTGPNQKIVGKPPFTPRVKKALALAIKEAQQFKHIYVGIEHILLGLMREGDGVAAKVLGSLGMELEKTRTEILKELDPNFEPASTATSDDSTKESGDSRPRFEVPSDTLPSPEAIVEAIGNLTPRAQQVLASAREEAVRLNHNFVGTEHLLLGLIALGQGVAANVLTKIGLDLETVRKEVEKQVGTGPDQKVVGNIPNTPRVRKVFKLAQQERRALNHTYLGTEHILLGLLREGDGVAAKIMIARDIDLAELRTEILRELDPIFSTKRTDTQGASPSEEKRPQTEPLRDWLSRYIKPDPIDLTKRYDVYCIHHGQSVVYRNVLFKAVKGLLQDRQNNINALYIELELLDGKSVFLPKRAIIKFADPGASAEGEPVPPPKDEPPKPKG